MGGEAGGKKCLGKNAVFFTDGREENPGILVSLQGWSWEEICGKKKCANEERLQNRYLGQLGGK